MHVLITGNMGYVGAVLVRHLRRSDPGIKIGGFDLGFFAHLLTGARSLPETQLASQVIGDVRELTMDVLQDVDAVVHLAALSNDPIGDEFGQATEEINRDATVRLATMAAQAHVRSFVFASSCSVYGHTEERPRRETDPVEPLTAYARSKIGAETALAQTDLGGMICTSLRFATACGMSDRLRLDLVLNDFVASALSTGKVSVLSDGSPWRPLIDVEDMARAISWAIRRRTEEGGAFLVANAGTNDHNYQVRELAEAVARSIPGTELSVNTAAAPDNRSYKVDFSLFARLAPEYTPRVSLDSSIKGLHEGLERMHFHDPSYRESSYVRLNCLREHVRAGRLSRDLHWTIGQGNEIP